MHKIFGSIRFTLTRFGRIINLFDALMHLHKKKRFALNLPVSMQAPAKVYFLNIKNIFDINNDHPMFIRRIQQLESNTSSELDPSKKQQISSPLTFSPASFSANSNSAEMKNRLGSSGG